MNRIGMGYDSHRLVSGRPLILGGVQIEHDLGLTGHSDADAVLHAITDAILGAIAAGDIGELFPDTDPQWAGADSQVFLRRAVSLAAQGGYRVSNCDVTIIAQQPKLSPFKPQMQASIAKIIGVDIAAVSVKAKTNEGMGPIGRGEGIAVMAAVLLTTETL
ncbi:MAG: 2-C-methyl-D-erythritol 2,4-cyclodiphosphate synthase [Planctomycetaceae bacterium]|nr:2-C-methyl-D-erythritol 2,4-cyclodiphosphate synthase [Planctomycetaceae bacterium]